MTITVSLIFCIISSCSLTSTDKVVILGDSTAADYPVYQDPIAGWGEFIRPKSGNVLNLAVPGMSTKSYIELGYFSWALAQIQPNDCVIVSLGHNDRSNSVQLHTDPETSYKQNLMYIYSSIVQKNACVLLVTPVCERVFVDGKIVNTHVGYQRAMIDFGKENSIKVIDLTDYSLMAIQELNDSESRQFYLYTDPGEYPGFPEGKSDDTHLSKKGARFFGEWITANL